MSKETMARTHRGYYLERNAASLIEARPFTPSCPTFQIIAYRNFEDAKRGIDKLYAMQTVTNRDPGDETD